MESHHDKHGDNKMEVIVKNKVSVCTYNLSQKVNKTMLANFFKCADFIEKKCPKLNGVFSVTYSPYYKTDLLVENGKAMLAYGNHGGITYGRYLSKEGTAEYSQGSMQSKPYFYKNVYAFSNELLQEFLSKWERLKDEIITKDKMDNYIMSEEFKA